MTSGCKVSYFDTYEDITRNICMCRYVLIDKLID